MSATRRAVPRGVAAALVALGATVPLLVTLRAPFLYDDTTIVRDNAWLRGWDALVRVWAQPYWPAAGPDTAGLYRPLHVALLATMWNLARGAPVAFHLYALALHLFVALLVWRLLRRAVGTVPAAAGAVWFATHPLHVEAVASVANAAELLVVACTIGLTFVVLAGSERSDASDGWGRAIAGAALAAAAILSKESGLLALPLAAVTAWGWRPPERAVRVGDVFRRSSRLWLAGSAAVVAALLARTAVLGAAGARASMAAPGLAGLSATERVTTMLSLWPRIGAMLVWPTTLSPYYGPTILPDRRGALAALALLVVAMLVVAALVLSRGGERRPLVALAWIALTYLPASNLLAATGPLVGDRILFGATVGASMALAWILDRLPRSALRVALLVLALTVARQAVHAARYASAWTSHRALWTQLVRASPGEYRGYELLGIDASARGDGARAVELLSRAFSMEPRDRRLRFEYGQALYAAHRWADAADVLAPLLASGDVRRERGFVAMYLDAVGRARGPSGVVAAGTPLLHGEAAAMAALYVGAAQEQLGRSSAADSAYALGLRAAPDDSLLRVRHAALEAREGRR